MKKLILACTLFAAITLAKPVKIGVTPIPNPDILEFIREDLKKDGIEIEIVEFSDYVSPNLALADGSLDANAFQHIPFLKKFCADRGLDLVDVGVTFVSPIALYSQKYKNVKDIPDGAKISLPNDPTNGARALILLHDEGLIKLKDRNNLTAGVIDIAENPHKYQFIELDAAQVPRSLGDVDAALINANYAVAAGLAPATDNILIEKAGADNPYVNVFAVRTSEKDREDVKTIVKHYQTEKVRKYMLEKFKGAYLPAF
ncbi:MAG: MetQ/NlpA family ABC transporter substrate-binding protein [Fusobacteriaceae bacterium]|jgi:D-methionine transport system substrate-binding protein|nr:MetQ/NlpA family ABC transporter substrate-binding protein [Fusobacteriaceae bacterium]